MHLLSLNVVDSAKSIFKADPNSSLTMNQVEVRGRPLPLTGDFSGGSSSELPVGPAQPCHMQAFANNKRSRCSMEANTSIGKGSSTLNCKLHSDENTMMAALCALEGDVNNNNNNNNSKSPSKRKAQPFGEQTSNSHVHGQPATNSTNPSLQFLIARARRGGSRTGSAGGSPAGRLQLHADLQHHNDLSRAANKLRWIEVQQLVDDCQMESIADVANDCLKRSEEEASRSSPDAQTSTPPTPKASGYKSRRVSNVSDSDEEEAVQRQRATSEDHSVFHLPDPTSISRRNLFAMSRRMCSYSSMDSFSSNGPHEDGACRETTNQPARISSSSAHSHLQPHAAAAAAMEEVANAAAPKPTAHHPAAEGDDHSIMSVEDHDEMASDDDSMLSSEDDLEAMPATGNDDDDDDSSIAFSLDSVDMRKKQFDTSNHSAPTRSSTGSGQAPFQHVVCDNDLDDASMLQRCFQMQARLSGVDEEEEEDLGASLTSLCSLDSATDPWGEEHA